MALSALDLAEVTQETDRSNGPLTTKFVNFMVRQFFAPWIAGLFVVSGMRDIDSEKISEYIGMHIGNHSLRMHVLLHGTQLKPFH